MLFRSIVATLGADLIERPTQALELAHVASSEYESGAEATAQLMNFHHAAQADDRGTGNGNPGHDSAAIRSAHNRENADSHYSTKAGHNAESLNQEKPSGAHQRRQDSHAPSVVDTKYKTRQQVQAVVDMLLAAEYLQVPQLTNALVTILADWMVGLTPAQIQTQFDLTSDLDHNAIDELRRQLGWPSCLKSSHLPSEPATQRASDFDKGKIGGWHDLPWPIQRQVLHCYRSVAPDAHLLVALFVCRSWRFAFCVPMPQAPLIIAQQLLAAGPNCDTLFWAFGEARMPAQWLSQDAAHDMAKHPCRRQLLSWFEDRDIFDYRHRHSVWSGLKDHSTLDDMRWALEYKQWPTDFTVTEMAHSCDDVAKVQYLHAHIHATDPESLGEPQFILHRALDGNQIPTAVWAWDKLGANKLANLRPTDGPFYTNMSACDQLRFGVLTGRKHLVVEAAACFRSDSPRHLAMAIDAAVTAGRMDMVEWAWHEYLDHMQALCPMLRRRLTDLKQNIVAQTIEIEDEVAISVLGNIAGYFLRAAMKPKAMPGLIDWVWERFDTQPLCAIAIRYEFDTVIRSVHWHYNNVFDAINNWAIRHTELTALSRLHGRIPFKAEGLVQRAIEHNRMDIVKWCAKHSDPTQWGITLMGLALLHNRLDMARWLYARGVPYIADPRCDKTLTWPEYKCAVLTCAAKSGSIEAVQWTVDTLLASHGGTMACMGGMRVGVLAAAANMGHLPVIQWLVDVGGMNRPSDISLVAECAAAKGHLNVLWWLLFERGWTIVVDKQHLVLWERVMQPQNDEEQWLTQEEKQREEARQPCEIVIRRYAAKQSPIASQWLINADCWRCKLPNIST